MFWNKKPGQDLFKVLDRIEKIEGDMSILKIHQAELEGSIRILNTKTLKRLGKMPKEEEDTETKDIYRGVLLPDNGT